MVAILGLLILVVAALVIAAGVSANGGGTHPLGSDFSIAGLHLSGLSVGELFLYGVVVGGLAMLGLSMVLGTFSRRLASHRSRKALTTSRREADGLRLDRERLTQQLDESTHRGAAEPVAGANGARLEPQSATARSGGRPSNDLRAGNDDDTEALT
jgi:hypothetical protein